MATRKAAVRYSSDEADKDEDVTATVVPIFLLLLLKLFMLVA